MRSRLLPLLLLTPLLLGGCPRRSVESNPPPAPTPVNLATALDHNLLLNGDAEAIMVGEKPPQKPVPAQWRETPDVFSTDYGDSPDEWPDSKPGCPDGRKRYFRLGLAINEPGKSISQTISLGALQNDLDAGQVECALGGWFGGWTDGDASSRLEVDFLDARGKVLASLATEPPGPGQLPKPAHGRASLAKVLATAPVPAGTRSIEARLAAIRMDKTVDTNAVATADNLSVVLRKKSP